MERNGKLSNLVKQIDEARKQDGREDFKLQEVKLINLVYHKQQLLFAEESIKR